MDDVSKPDVIKFRGQYLPALVSPRAPNGLSVQTIEKKVGLLRNLWRWAIARGHSSSRVNPWLAEEEDVRKTPRKKTSNRDLFSPAEAGAIMKQFPRGERLGDVFRLALISGCRADEIAKVLLDNIADDYSWFLIPEGKSHNAKRVIPVPTMARELLSQRVEFARNYRENPQNRLFPDFPLRPSTGKASSLSQLFTRERRKVLGEASDGRLTFHSLRHTWFTIARRAGVPLNDTNDLGGWAGERTLSSAYDHKLLLADLAKRQEMVAKRFEADGYLKEF